MIRLPLSGVALDTPRIALKDCPGITDRVECRPTRSDLGVDFLEISKDISEMHDDEPGEAGGAPRCGVISGQAFSPEAARSLVRAHRIYEWTTPDRAVRQTTELGVEGGFSPQDLTKIDGAATQRLSLSGPILRTEPVASALRLERMRSI